MANVEAFVLFCEDVRREAGGKQSFLGVLGGSLYVAPGTEHVDELKAICFARIKAIRSVKVSLKVRAEIDGKTMGPDEDYSAVFSQDELDESENWTLQVAADLKGLPLGAQNVVHATFNIEDVSSSGMLPIIYGSGPPERDSKVAEEKGGVARQIKSKRQSRGKKA